MQDALALRHGQDETQQAAYGIQRASQVDPYLLNEARNQSGLSDINSAVQQRQYNTGNTNAVADAQAEMHRLQPATTLANYGYNGQLLQDIPNLVPGATASPTGVTTNVGGNNYTSTPYGNIDSTGRIHQQWYGAMQQLRAQHYAEMNDAAQGRLELQRELAGYRYPQGTQPSSITGSGAFHGLGGGQTSPAVNAAQQPQQTPNYAQQYGISISNPLPNPLRSPGAQQ